MVSYLERDLIEAGPMMDLVGHAPEPCNEVAVDTLESINPDRTFASPGQTPLLFDSTTFTDPAGRATFAYKGAWMQGFGSRDIREGLSRKARFDNSFVRGRGTARVIEVGIAGAKDEPQAWQIFQSEVLAKLKWTP